MEAGDTITNPIGTVESANEKLTLISGIFLDFVKVESYSYTYSFNSIGNQIINCCDIAKLVALPVDVVGVYLDEREALM